MKTDDILDERAETYGAFIDNAKVSQNLKAMCEESRNWDAMDYDQLEAVHMICSKLSRLLTGDCNHIDSWADIAGYATLVSDRLSGNAR